MTERAIHESDSVPLEGASEIRTDISSLVQRCLATFGSLSTLQHENTRLNEQIIDECGRFRVWTGNVSGHTNGRRSLQYRLRDSPELSTAVSQYLLALNKALESVPASISLSQTEEIPDSCASGLKASGDDDDDTFGPVKFDTSLNEALDEVSEITTYLLRISMTFRDPARIHPIRYAETTDTKHYEPHDIDHVKTKFASVSFQLAERYVRQDIAV